MSPETSTAAIRTRGINHLALVCRDMARTVDFYTNVLGMPLVKTIEFPEGRGQHFFFDCGGGATVAFFWFPDAPDPAPGISMPEGLPDRASLLSAVGSMTHVAFDVGPDEIDALRDRLIGAGVEVTEIWNHDDSEWGLSPTPDGETVFVRSVYFRDPDGTLLELAAWTRTMGQPGDVRHTPATATATADGTEEIIPV
jgi:catechol 2,3-dioxygenase-like lactoylglutathione lyase family enzyme